MKNTLIYASILIIGMSIFVYGIEQAWWVTVEYEAKGNMIEGIPINDINKDWTKVRVLTNEDLPAEELGESSNFKANGASFSIISDFDNDSKMEKAVVGVYENVNKERGSFLLILHRTKNDKWKKVFLANMKDKCNFSALSLRGKMLLWLAALNTDNYGTLTFGKKGYELDWNQGE